MHLAPGKRFDGHVQHIGARSGDFQHGSRGETGSRVSVILDENMGIFLLDVAHQPAEHGRTADAGHVLETDLICARLHDLVHDAHVVRDRMDRRMRNGERYLRNHSTFLGKIH